MTTRDNVTEEALCDEAKAEGSEWFPAELARFNRRGPMLQCRTWRKSLRLSRKLVRNAFLPRQLKRHAHHDQ